MTDIVVCIIVRTSKYTHVSQFIIKRVSASSQCAGAHCTLFAFKNDLVEHSRTRRVTQTRLTRPFDCVKHIDRQVCPVPTTLHYTWSRVVGRIPTVMIWLQCNFRCCFDLCSDNGGLSGQFGLAKDGAAFIWDPMHILNSKNRLNGRIDPIQQQGYVGLSRDIHVCVLNNFIRICVAVSRPFIINFVTHAHEHVIKLGTFRSIKC